MLEVHRRALALYCKPVLNAAFRSILYAAFEEESDVLLIYVHSTDPGGYSVEAHKNDLVEVFDTETKRSVRFPMSMLTELEKTTVCAARRKVIYLKTKELSTITFRPEATKEKLQELYADLYRAGGPELRTSVRTPQPIQYGRTSASA